MSSPGTIQRQRFQKVILIFIFLLLSVALLVSWSTPATGYEASIYRSTPLILWASLIMSVIAGTILAVVAIVNDELSENSFWKIGFLLIFLSYVVCLALFIIRGYYMWAMTTDPAIHFGFIKETLSEGHAPTTLIYPITHIYLSEVILLTSLDLVFLHKIVPLMFEILCVLFMYVFAKALVSRTAEALLAGVISCCLTFEWWLNLTPNALANLFLPFALFLVVRYLQRKSTWPWALILSIVILFYPLFHPVPAFFLGLVFLTLWIPPILPRIIGLMRERKLGNFYFSKQDLRLILSLMLPLMLLLICFIYWISLFSQWGLTIQSIYQAICSEADATKMMELADQISYAQGYGYSVIEQVIRRFWGPIILSILSVISLPLIWEIFAHGHQEKCLFSFYGPLGILALIIPLLYLFNLAFGPLRFMIYVSMLGTVFAAYLFAHLLSKAQNTAQKKPKLNALYLRAVFVVIIIFGLFVGGMLNLYPSPYNLTQSCQNTRSEVVGMAYIYEHRDTNIPLSRITVAPARFAIVLLTPEERSVQQIPLYLEDQVAPWHFGYDKYPSISFVYDEETDLVIKQRDKVIYIDYFPDMAQYRYTSQDFERLEDDFGVNLLYSNGGFDQWRISVAV